MPGTSSGEGPTWQTKAEDVQGKPIPTASAICACVGRGRNGTAGGNDRAADAPRRWQRRAAVELNGSTDLLKTYSKAFTIAQSDTVVVV
jgi:hypothetical protein